MIIISLNNHQQYHHIKLHHIVAHQAMINNPHHFPNSVSELPSYYDPSYYELYYDAYLRLLTMWIRPPPAQRYNE